MRDSLTIDHGGRKPYRPNSTPEVKAARIAAYKAAAAKTQALREQAIAEREASRVHN